MAQLTASQLLQRVYRKIHNTQGKLGGETEVLKILDEANRTLQLKVDFISAKRTAVPVLVFHDIYEYPIAADIAYDKMIEADFEKELDRLTKSNFQKTTPKFLFNARNPYVLNSYMTANNSSGYVGGVGYGAGDGQQSPIQTMGIEFENASPYFMLKTTEQQAATQISDCDSYDGNGTWINVSDTTNIRTDNQRYKQGAGSVAFNTSGGSTTISLENSTLTAVNLSQIVGKGYVTMWVELPNTTLPTSFTIRVGSDSSNYYEMTASVKQSGLPFIPGWNLLGFHLETATTVGTPDDENIDYFRFTMTYPSVVSAIFRIDDIWARFGKECTLKYYSKYLVTDVNGVRKENFTATDDSTILQQEEVDLLVYEAAICALKQIRQFNEADNLSIFHQKAIDTYMQKHPSQQEIESMSYYLL